MKPPSLKRLNHYIATHGFRILLVLVLLSLAILYIHPAGDTDLFWHLKSGEIIFKDLKIPQEDQLSFTTYEGIKPSEIPRIRYILE